MYKGMNNIIAHNTRFAKSFVTVRKLIITEHNMNWKYLVYDW